MNNNVSLLVNSGSSTSQVMSVNAGRPIKIKIQPGCKYLLKNKTDNYAPENVTLQRNGDDLYVILEGDSTPAIVIQDYYVSGNNEPILGMAEDDQLYAYMVTNGSSLGEGYQFENGALASAALGGRPLGDGAYLFNDTDHDHDLLALWPWFLGVAALGALAAVVFNKDDDSSSPAPAPLPASVPGLSGVMDATGSITGPIAYGSSTDEQKPLIYGTGDAGNTITIYDNGNVIGSTTVGADGNWSFKPAAALGEGDHAITITQTNSSGSTSASSDDFWFTIDITAPQRPLFNDIIDDVGSIQGPITNGAVIDDARPEITGSGEAGNTITVFVDGKEFGTTIVDSEGHWSFTPASDFTDGHHQITVTETDKAGNTSPVSPTFDFTVDTIAPAIPTIESAIDDVGTIQGRLSHGGATDDPTPTLIGKAEINSIVKVYDGSVLLGSAVANGITGEWVFTPAKPISEGEHRFHVTATDKAGNTSQPSLDFVLTTDYTPPDRSKLAITGVEDQEGATVGNVINNGMTDDARPIISGTGTAGDTIVVYVKDATGSHEIGQTLVDKDGKWNLQPATPLLPGNNQFTAIESDPVGNATTPSDPYSVNLDIVKPVEPVIVNIVDKVGPITGALQKGAITDDNQPTITGTARAGYTVHVYDGVSLLGSVVADSKGVWHLMPEKALADGKHNITATATSPEGDVSKHTGVFNFEVDTKVPAAPESLVINDNTGQEQGPLNDGDTTDNNTPAISGNTEPGSTVVIYDNGEKIGEVTADPEGNWIFVPDAPLADGEHDISVTIRDEAGNTNTDGPEISIIIDTSKVLVSITTLIDDVGSVTGSIKPQGTTDDVRPEVIGQGKVGNLIKVYDGKTLIGTTTVKADGTWSLTPTKDLSEGKHSITATATDLSGNLSNPTAAFEFTIDISAPAIPVIQSAKDDVGSIQGALSSGSMTDDSTPTLIGKAEKGSIVIVYDGIILLGSVVADSVTGEWSLTPATPISEGEHKFHATATDAAGNISKPSADFILTTDYTAPDISKLVITGVDDRVGDITGNVENGGLTDDTRPVINGTGTAGDTIVVYTKDASGRHEIGNTTVDANGKWSLIPTSPLLPGQNQFTAMEMDSVGNTTDLSAPYSIKLDVNKLPVPVIVNLLDDVGPITGPLEKGDVTDDNRPTIVGTAEAGYTIHVYDGITLLGTVVADSYGVWILTPATALVDGKHNITATATSPTGQVSQPTGAFNFEVDTKAPNAVDPLTIKDNVGEHTGTLINGDTTDDNTPTFEGKAEANSTITIYDNGNVIGSTTADADGKWSFTPNDALTDGDYAFSTTVTDAAGNTSAASPDVHIIIDSSAVVVSISKLVDNVGSITGNITPTGVTDDTRPEIIGEGKSGSVIKVYDNVNTLLGSTTVKSDGSWSFTPTSDLSEGSHSITAIATDKVGNVSQPTSAFEFSVDTTAPAIPTIESAQDDVGAIQGTLFNGGMTDDPTPTLVGKAENSSIVKVYDGSILLGSTVANSLTGEWHFTPATPISEGAHQFHVNAVDAAGNTSKPSANFILTIDYTAPDISKLAITDIDDQVGLKTGNVLPGETTDDTRPTINGTGTKDDTVIVFTTDSSGKHEIGRATVDANGKWHLKPVSPLLPGKNDFTAIEVDPVGNQAGPSAEYRILINTQPPEPPVIERVEDNVNNIDGMVIALQKSDVTDDNTPTVIGTAVANGIVTIFNQDVAIGSVKADADGKWTFTPSPALVDGKYEIRVSVIDTIGRISEKTGPFDFTVDTTAPAKATDLVIIDNEGDWTGALSRGDTTDDSTPTFTGKAEANGTVTIYNGNSVVGKTDANSNGDWTFTPSTALADGDYTFTITVTDKAGNTGVATDKFDLTIDTSKVTVKIVKLLDDVGDITGAITPNIGVTDDTRPEVIGEGKTGSVIKVYDGENLLGSTSVKADGSWNFTPSSDLGQGSHSITATATDKTGNTSPKTSPFVFEIDSVKPSVPTIDSAIDDVGVIQGTLNNNSWTDDPTPTLMGKAEKGSVVKVYDGEALLGSVTANSTTGEWSFTPVSGLSEGEHKFHVTATDKAGNVSDKSADFILTMDFTAPSFDALSIAGVNDQVGVLTGNVASGGETDDTRPTISGTGTVGDTITVYTKDSSGNHIIGTAKVIADGTWSLRPASPLLPGENKFTAKEMDLVGNTVGPCEEYSITLNVVPPAPPVIERVEDNVGNPNNAVVALQKDDVTNDNTPTIIGTAVANGIVIIFNNDVAIGSTKVSADNKWSFTPSPALIDGKYEIRANVIDTIGRTSEKTGPFGFTVDTTAPGKATDLVVTDNEGDWTGILIRGDTTDDSTPTFTGKAEANGTVTIYNGNTLVGKTEVNSGGDWTFTPSTALADGDYEFIIKVTDKAGNTGAATDQFNLTIDTTKVTVKIVKLLDDVGDITGPITPTTGVTDDTRPEVVGEGKTGSVIKVYDGENLLGSTTVKADGSWSFTPSSDLGQGSHSITATATDKAGNTSPKTTPFVFEIDTVKPSVPTIDSAIDDVGDIQGTLNNNSWTDDPTPTLVGKAEKGSIVKVYDGEAFLGSVTANSSTGEWSFTPVSGLPEGEHKFHVTATDKAGNASDKSADFTLTMDYTPPPFDALSITGVDDRVGALTGNVISGGETDDTRPTISGTGTAGDTITVYTKDSSGNHAIGTAKVIADGTWSLKPASPLLPGKNEFTAEESDPVGNKVGPCKEYIVTLNVAPPAPPVIERVEDNVGNPNDAVVALQKDEVTNDNTPTIIGTAVANGIVTIFSNDVAIGTAKVSADNKWSFTPSPALIDGKYEIRASVTDTIGRASEKTGPFGFTVDTTAPGKATDLVVIDNEGDWTGILTSGDITDDSTPTFTGKAEANSTVTIYNGNTVVGKADVNGSGDWTFTPSTALIDGDYKFTITVTDKAGNTGAATDQFDLTIDTSKVTVKIVKLLDDIGDITGPITPGTGVTDDTRPEIIGEGKTGSIIKVYDGENLLGSTTVKADGSWTFTPTVDMGQGTHSITATATDLAGNTSPKTSPFIFEIDTLKPSMPTIDSAVDDVGDIQGSLANNGWTDDPTPTLIGKAEKGSTVKVYDGDALLGTVVANSTTGAWSFTPASGLPEGEHKFHVTATDKAGNVSSPSTDFILTLDFTPPPFDMLAITGVDDRVGIITGNVKSGGITDDSRPTISGTGTAGDTITVYTTDSTNNHVIGTAKVDDNGQWSLRPAVALIQGENKFTAVETDPVGNSTEPCAPYTITLDTFISDAKVTITAITEDRGSSSTDFITNDNTLLISGTLDKALKSDETVEITLDSGKTWTKATTLTDSAWTVDLQTKVLTDGDYTINARVVDTAGNVGSTDSHALSIITESRDMNGLGTTTKVTTDTSHGLVSGDLFSHSATLTNTDMVTRDRNVTVTGTLSAALLAGEKLQISLDDGTTWKTLTMTGNNWSYVLPEVSADTTYNFKLQVIDNAGNLGRNTTFAESYKVVIDLTVPDMITAAPDIAKHVSTKDAFTFDSSHYGTVEAGTIVALVSDENRNGSYQEGLDQVLGFAKANADGTWSMTTKLPAGAHNLAFMVWDEAGNHSSMGAATSVGVTDGEGSLLITQKWGGTTDSDGRGLNSAAVTISQDGLWSFFQSVRGTSGTTTANAGRVYTATDQENYTSTYLAQPTTANGAGYDVDNNSYSRYVNSAVFADINRDGYTDVMSQVSSYLNNGRTAYWLQNADGTFSPKAVNQGSDNHLGGVIAYDREGDGYLDFVLADSEADSISFLKNDKGVLSYESVSGFPNGHPGGALPTGLSIMHEVGAVDIDNNGTVDITAHIDYNGAGNFVGNTSRGLGILYNQLTNNGSGKTNFGSVGYYANVFTNDGHEDYGNLSISMTYADFNGDGWLDLFLSRGSKAGANSDESRIYLNDGTGRLIAQDSQALWFGDNLAGGTSLAVDWNHDGKMDIIEIPRSGVNGSPTLYTNLGTDVWNGGGVSLTGSTKFDNITGAVALDYDWDGSMDIVLYRSGSDADVVSSTSSAPTLLVKNTNIAADGTSLQIRIVDGFGINTYYSNTVKLYDSKGACVATQLINPQASGSSNSMGLVSFFGLDPNEVYSVQLLRITNGVTDHVGAVPLIGGLANNTVNANWGGLTTSKSHDAYVLTAESSNATNNTVGTAGIIGTGYNDTFFGSGGDDTYTGGGGWNLIVSGQQVWSETAGLDIVDYSRSAAAITANLGTGIATGWGTDKLVSIEGLIGSAQGDTFTDSAANNLFEGRGGNDTFYLTNGGNDVLMYKVLAGKSGDGRGGNGHDTVYGFTVGNLLTNDNADLIDLGDVLNYSGSYSCFMDDGKMTLDFASQGILNYLKVDQLNGDTIISIDRDGKGGAYGFEELLTLKGVSTDLVTLLSNNQIEVGDDTLSSASSATHSLLSTTQQSLLSISQMYTAGDDILFGTEKADILMGGLGNDTFIHIGKGDQIMGGAGNDVIKLASTDFAYISGDEGIDTLILEGKNELLDLGALKDKLESIEIFDMGDASNTMKVSLDDVLRLGSEELAIHSGDKAIIVNGEEGSTLKLEGGDGQWTMSHSHYQHAGNTYNVWTVGTSGIEVLVENTVNSIIM